MRISASRLFPLLLMLALAMLSLWLEHAVLDEARAPVPRRHNPDYIVENFSVATYNREGATESTLAAAKMIHFPDDDSTELLAPHLVQTKAGQPRMTITAGRGALSQNGEEVFLYDNVVLVRDAAEGVPEARMMTDFLHLVRARSLVRTDRDVAISEAGRVLSGRGMEYYNDSRQLYLHDQVRGRFEKKGAS